MEKTFRGKKLAEPTEIYRTSYKTDYQLIPKNEEAKFLASVAVQKPEVILPNSIEMPPLMAKFIAKVNEKKGLDVSHIITWGCLLCN